MARSTGPVYRRIADDLRAQITSGALGPGAQLPTESVLTEKYSVTRATVRQAVGVLVNEGLVVSVRPHGHFVREVERMLYRPQREWRRQAETPEMDRFMAEQTELGREPSQVISIELVAPPADVAQRLNLVDGETAVVRKRVRYLDGQPFNTNDSYFPLSIVEGSPIMYPADIAEGANSVLSSLGADQVRAIDEIEIRMPTPEETLRLDLSPGVPVAVHRLTGYTEDGRPVRCVVNVLPGDRHVIMYERTKNGEVVDVGGNDGAGS